MIGELRVRVIGGPPSEPPRVLDAESPRIFIFAITMGNHGPWREAGPPINSELRRAFNSIGLARGGELLRYLDSPRQSDEMLRFSWLGCNAATARE